MKVSPVVIQKKKKKRISKKFKNKDLANKFQLSSYVLVNKFMKSLEKDAGNVGHSGYNEQLQMHEINTPRYKSFKIKSQTSNQERD